MVLLVGSTVLAVDIAIQCGGDHGTVKGCVEAYLLIACTALYLYARQPIVPMFLCLCAVKVKVVVWRFGRKVLCCAIESCS